MRSPLDTMILRRAELDALVTINGVTDRLKTTASPIGGMYGNVRSSGTKAHKGWDLYAAVNTYCQAITDGSVVEVGNMGTAGYGRWMSLELSGPDVDALATRLKVKKLYAFYGHLSGVLMKFCCVKEGAAIAQSGNSGNAGNTPPHLHFEIRKTAVPKKGDESAIDPAELLGSSYIASRGDDVTRVKAIYGLK